MKALVLETRGDRAAILLDNGTIRVARGDYSVGDTIDYLAAALPALRQWIAAAAAVIVLLGAGAGWWVDRNYVAYAEISLDVNPSIRYTVNKRNRVLSVTAVNSDAEDIVEALRRDGVRFEPVSTVMEKTLSALEDEGYLDEQTQDYVLVNVSADDETRQDDLAGQVETVMTRMLESDPTLEYRIDRSDRETSREAEKLGMSAGRYAAWQQASFEREGEGEPEPQEYSQKPVREIIDAAVEDAPRDEGERRNDFVPQAEGPARDAADPRDEEMAQGGPESEASCHEESSPEAENAPVSDGPPEEREDADQQRQPEPAEAKPDSAPPGESSDTSREGRENTTQERQDEKPRKKGEDPASAQEKRDETPRQKRNSPAPGRERRDDFSRQGQNSGKKHGKK